MSSNPLDIFLPQKPAPEEAWRWGMVTQVSPLRVRLDGDSGSLNGTPSNLAGLLQVGQRVYVHVQRGMTPVVIGAAGGSGAISLGSRHLTGNSHVNNNRFTVPVALRGSFARYELILAIGVSGVTSIRAISVLFNGDTNSAYRSFGNWIGDTQGTYSNNATAFPRTGYAHSQVGSMRINIVPAFTGSTGSFNDWVYWDATGYWNPGAAVGGTFSTGGRWNGPSSQGEGRINTINFGSPISADTWTSNSRAYLWGYR